MGAKKRMPLKSLRRGRPPMAQSTRSMSRKAGRTLINSHHQLEKRRRRAKAEGDDETEAAMSAEIAALGGLEQYQQASLQGQSLERGGDTSKILLEWLPISELRSLGRRLRMLEIGALSTRNACSTSGLFDMVHIDLKSREPGILQQDFMERPLPGAEAEKFDIISLSLVLNFVPEAATRGLMLARSLSFLRGGAEKPGLPTPSLFMVLPRSCVTNSRYFSETRLQELMGALGYELVKAQQSHKLAYSLWQLRGAQAQADIRFTKQEVNPGRKRNNFVVTLSHPVNQRQACIGESRMAGQDVSDAQAAKT